MELKLTRLSKGIDLGGEEKFKLFFRHGSQLGGGGGVGEKMKWQEFVDGRKKIVVEEYFYVESQTNLK